MTVWAVPSGPGSRGIDPAEVEQAGEGSRRYQTVSGIFRHLKHGRQPFDASSGLASIFHIYII